MPLRARPTALILKHPGAFALRTLRGFRANQGLLLAGAVAYYALLSIVPLLILTVIALSHVVDQGALLQTLGHYLEWLVPGQSKAIVVMLSLEVASTLLLLGAQVISEYERLSVEALDVAPEPFTTSALKDA